MWFGRGGRKEIGDNNILHKNIETNLPHNNSACNIV
jgi:hypothetical protein